MNNYCIIIAYFFIENPSRGHHRSEINSPSIAKSKIHILSTFWPNINLIGPKKTLMIALSTYFFIGITAIGLVPLPLEFSSQDLNRYDFQFRWNQEKEHYTINTLYNKLLRLYQELGSWIKSMSLLILPIVCQLRFGLISWITPDNKFKPRR